MGRYLFKLGVFLSLIAGIGNYVVYLGTGRVPFNDLWQHFKKTPVEIPKPGTLDLPSLPKLPSLGGKQESRAYKWMDKNGVVHYADQPPDGQNAQLINVDPDQNLVQGSPPPVQESAPAKTKTTPSQAASNPVLNGSPAMDNASMQQLLQQIKAAAESAKQRPIE
ncbi:MAG TPA: DUF4124 domain-containing protein [Marinagarivorans sp.]|nr:DUF4124 domain-containing protein [Cellvibrionaceae bacterium]HMY38247.1 DUF4124 domain-containing protein [Marinagarivorans sp.]HNG61712.1 DUF4124 domain-containing protein [Cellvibrionaceae bacterium]